MVALPEAAGPTRGVRTTVPLRELAGVHSGGILRHLGPTLVVGWWGATATTTIPPCFTINSPPEQQRGGWYSADGGKAKVK